MALSEIITEIPSGPCHEFEKFSPKTGSFRFSCAENGQFTQIQYDQISDTFWCTAAPKFLPFALAEKFKFSKGDFLISQRNLLNFCRTIWNSPCGRYLNTENSYETLWNAIGEKEDISELDFQKLVVNQTYYCVDLIENLKLPRRVMQADLKTQLPTKSIPKSKSSLENQAKEKTDQVIEIAPGIDVQAHLAPNCDKPNESFSNCLDCENTCEFFDFTLNELPQRKCACKISGCACNEGYARVNGFCVEAKKHCRNLNCLGRPNEKFEACYGIPFGLEKDCLSLHSKNDDNEIYKSDKSYQKSGCQPGCVCTTGHVRNSLNQCVPVSQCGRCRENYTNFGETVLWQSSQYHKISSGGSNTVDQNLMDLDLMLFELPELDTFAPKCDKFQLEIMKSHAVYKDLNFNPVQYHKKTKERWCAIIPKYSPWSISTKFVYSYQEVQTIDLPGVNKIIDFEGLEEHCLKMTQSECAKDLINFFVKDKTTNRLVVDKDMGTYWPPIQKKMLQTLATNIPSCRSLIINEPKFPIKCQANAYYKNCGSNCEPSCERSVSIFCENSCKEGCFCKEGYIKASHDSNECIPKEECPLVECLNENEEMSECANCEDTCENFDLNIGEKGSFIPLLCNCQTDKPACSCKPGYARLDGHCVKAVDYCPKSRCGHRKNEMFKLCNGIDKCNEQSCSDLQGPKKACFPKSGCHSGCICQKGYVRDSNNACIPANECPRCSEWQNSRIRFLKIKDGASKNIYMPSCDENERFNVVQIDQETGERWCTIVPRYSYWPLSDKFRYQSNEIVDELVEGPENEGMNVTSAFLLIFIFCLCSSIFFEIRLTKAPSSSKITNPTRTHPTL